MKRILFVTLLLVLFSGCVACRKYNDQPKGGEQGTDQTSLALARTNLTRAMQLVSAAKENYFRSPDMAMSRYYNPFTGIKSSELGSVWMYTSAIEAVNSILNGCIALKEHGDSELYDSFYGTYSQFLSDLVDNLEYYAGTYTLVSYTQTREWTVYGVNRSISKGTANVAGIENVYDDQQWLVRELIEAYRITGDNRYLEKAEYLAGYVIDGWDTTLDDNGQEHGGITWGPGYYTKHSCSNGPFVSPLVWLSQIYSGKGETIEYRYIGEGKKRLTRTMDKSEYYLMYAEKVYNFQRTHLYKKSEGVYWDMLGAKGAGGDNIAYETVDGVRYRGHNEEENPLGESYSYNSGTMLSGAADLYGVTGRQEYLDDMKALSVNSFRAFAKKCTKYPELYEYAVDGFNNWFNGVLLRGWVAVSEHYPNVDVQVSSFQNNLDHAYSLYLKNDMLPSSLIYGWNTNESQNNVEAMFTFAFAAEYAVMANYYLNK